MGKTLIQFSTPVSPRGNSRKVYLVVDNGLTFHYSNREAAESHAGTTYIAMRYQITNFEYRELKPICKDKYNGDQ